MGPKVKRCKRCGQEKPLGVFYRDTAGRDGHRPECKACTSVRRRAWYAANRDREIVRVRQWQVENRTRRQAYEQQYKESGKKALSDRASHLRRKFGLTVDEYEALLAEQGGGCAICGRRPRTISLHVDHDHDSGAVRGLLCFPCNNALGLVQESAEVASRAAEYLFLYQAPAEVRLARERAAGLRAVAH